MASDQSSEHRPMFDRPTLPLEFNEHGYITTYGESVLFPAMSGRLRFPGDGSHTLAVEIGMSAELYDAALYAAYIAYGLKANVIVTHEGKPLTYPIEFTLEDAATSERLDPACAEELLSRFETIEGTVGLRDESKLTIGAMFRSVMNRRDEEISGSQG